MDKSSSLYKVFFFKAFLCFGFFFNINSSYVYAARAKLVSLKSCLLFIQKNIGLYMEMLYLCIQINLNMFLIHVSSAEYLTSYSVEEALVQYSVQLLEKEKGYLSVVFYIYSWAIKCRIQVM